MKIIINGKEAELNGNPGHHYYKVSYETIVAMAGKNPARVLSVTWSTRNGQGFMAQRTVALVEEGMVFNVADTSGA